MKLGNLNLIECMVSGRKNRAKKKNTHTYRKIIFPTNFLREGTFFFFLRLHYTFILLISYQSMCVCNKIVVVAK